MSRLDRVQFGDFQTSDSLATSVVELVLRQDVRPASVVEPTCGEGSFLSAAMHAFPRARLMGFDISKAHIGRARRRLGQHADLKVADFFDVDWQVVLDSLPQPILLLGNPPWVTSSTLGVLGSSNTPNKRNLNGEPGLSAMTGRSNFDIAEAMLLELIAHARTKRMACAMLCKATTARRVMEFIAASAWPLRGATYSIDAREHFGAAVDAVLLWISATAQIRRTSAVRFAVYPRLQARRPSHYMGVVNGRAYSNLALYRATKQLEGTATAAWRSGVKHDLSSIMELWQKNGALVNGLEQNLRLEADYVYPLLKGSDLANGRTHTHRRVIVTQRSLGEDTRLLMQRAPMLWRYLTEHEKRFSCRKSSVYKNKPPFSMFGIGPYSFAPFKVAICGLYKRLRFVALSPVADRPVMLDDTCYFLPCRTRREAEALARLLNGEQARRFFEARFFMHDKRPIKKSLLCSLSLDTLLSMAEADHETPASSALAPALSQR